LCHAPRQASSHTCFELSHMTLNQLRTNQTGVCCERCCSTAKHANAVSKTSNRQTHTVAVWQTCLRASPPPLPSAQLPLFLTHSVAGCALCAGWGKRARWHTRAARTRGSANSAANCGQSAAGAARNPCSFLPVPLPRPPQVKLF
jgi:hypothetical protein